MSVTVWHFYRVLWCQIGSPVAHLVVIHHQINIHLPITYLVYHWIWVEERSINADKSPFDPSRNLKLALNDKLGNFNLIMWFLELKIWIIDFLVNEIYCRHEICFDSADSIKNWTANSPETDNDFKVCELIN